MAQDPESTRAKVRKRKPPSHTGGEAARRWAQDTVKQTHVNTNQPRLTPKPQTTSGPRLTRQPQNHQPSQVRDTKGDADRHRAAAFKRSKVYKRDTRAAYDAQSTARRSELAASLARRPDSPEAKSILPIHRSRVARNAELASSAATKDTKGNADYYRGRPKDLAAHNDAELKALAQKVLQAHHDSQYTDAGKDVKDDLEFATADAYKTTDKFRKDFEAAAKAGTQYKQDQIDKKYSGSVGALAAGFIHGEGPTAHLTAGLANAVGKAAPYLAAAAAPAVTTTLAAIDKTTGAHSLDYLMNTTENAGKELIDIPANTVPSLYYAAKPTVEGHPGQTAKLLLQPYKDLVKDPVGQFEKHPISTGLMVAGPLKGASHLGGTALKSTGKSMARSLEIVPGTSLETGRSTPKGLVGQIAARKSDKKRAVNPKGEVVMKDSAIRQRVNESFDHSQHNIREAAQNLLKQHKAAGGKVDDAARSNARALASTQRKMEESRMIDEFAVRAGAGKKLGTAGTHAVTATRKGKVATWTDKAEAEDFINRRDFKVPMAVRYDTNERVWKALPQAASNQLDQFGVGRDPVVSGPKAKAVQASVAAFRRTVLATPFTKWMAGNVAEAGLRSVLEGVGPRSIATGIAAARFAKRNYTDAEYQEFNHRVLAEGHYGMDLGLKMRSTPEDYGSGKLASIAKAMDALKYSKKSPAMPVYKLWEGWTGLVFNTLNGKMERAVRMGMLGKALRNSPLMTEKVVKLHAAAIHDAMSGAKNTSNMVQLGREVDRMYGKYSKFDPETRKLIANYTPFLAWYMNATKFVVSNLPADHPIVTAVIASASQASADWRKDHGLAVFEKGAAPGWLQGSIPIGTSKTRASHFTPFGLWGDLPGNWASVMMPLLNGSQQNLNGKDWKGDDLPPGVKDNPWARGMTAALTFTEATVPGTGVAYRYFTGKGSTKEKLKKEFIPGLPVAQKTPSGGSGLQLPKGFQMPSSDVSSGSLPDGFSLPGK
jgi:hypothetical protein